MSPRRRHECARHSLLKGQKMQHVVIELFRILQEGEMADPWLE
jgi:hypothetical protein